MEEAVQRPGSSGVIVVTFLGCLAMAASMARAAESAHHATGAHHWAYTGEQGPKHWTGTCSTGKEQSPIDIENAAPAELEPIAFDYHPAPLKIIDNGHSIQINYAPGSGITLGGQRYELAQFHFHKPSEEEIGGKHFAMVAHLVHKNAAGQLAVVAVLLQEGKSNPFIEALWQHLPSVKEKEEEAKGVTIDAGELLPGDRAYYTFAGSLTTPPCTEGVTWLVLKTPVEISAAQVARFGKIYSANARPVQPLNGRIVKVSK